MKNLRNMKQKENIKKNIKSLYSFIKNKYKNNIKGIKVILLNNNMDCYDLFFKTSETYNKKIILYINNRHIKDILRSFSVELVGILDENKTLENKYLKGNMLFREWTEINKK